MSELFLVPAYQPEGEEYGESIFERAGGRDERDVDEYLRREFGREAIAIISREILVFDNGTSSDAQRIDHEGATVAAVYLGLERATVRRVRLEAVSTLGVPEQAIAATFSTSHGPADVSTELYDRMQNNDTGVASLHGKIGVLLDEKVTFGELKDNSTSEADEETPRPFQLRVVQ